MLVNEFNDEIKMRKQFTPREYQKLIIGHQLDLERCGEWASMGMGKTVSTLTALDTLYMSGEAHPTLVLAPLRVCNSTWPEEAQKWEHLRNIDVIPVTGAEKERLNALKKDASVYAVNYQNIPWLVEQYGAHWPFATVVADESTRLKSFRLRQGGVRAQSLAKVAHTKIKRFVNLTGTPAPNGLLDLWGQTWFLDKGERLGKTYTAFSDRWFCRSDDGFSREIRSESAKDEIYNKLRDIYLTVDAKDWFDIKEPIVRNVEVDLPRAARQHYDTLKKELVVQIEQHSITAANAAVKTQKLLQIANGAAYTDPAVEEDDDPRARHYKVLHDAKIEAMESIIEESAGMPVLVAYNFRSDLERLLKAFKKAVVLDDNPETLKLWNKGRIPVLLAHPQSAGHGLNLQDGGNILVFFGHNWNLEDRLQIIERIGPVRQMQAGYDRPVFIYNIIARNTVDKLVMDRVETKKSVQELLMQNMKNY